MSVTYPQIFHSSGDERRWIQYGDINKLVNADIIKVRKVQIGLSEFTMSLINAPILEAHRLFYSRYARNFLNAGGEDHQRLNLIAAAYLIDQGHIPIPEQWANGKRVDLLTQDQKWIIECGDTDAAPIYKHLYYTCQFFGVLPYPVQSPILFVFERGAKWNQRKAQAYFNRPTNEGVRLGDE